MQPALPTPAVPQLADEFPGWEDLETHLSKAHLLRSESASTAEGSASEDSTPSTPTVSSRVQLRHPPGLEDEVPSPMLRMPAYVSSSLAAEWAMEEPAMPAESFLRGSGIHTGPEPTASQAALAKAVSAILTAQQDIGTQECTSESRKMLADVVRIAIVNLKKQQDVTPQRYQRGQESESASEVPRPRAFANREASLQWPPRPQQAAQGEKPVLSLDEAFPLELPKLPARFSQRSQMKELQGKDPKCVLAVRQLKKLGINSPEKLREYFEWYGEVDVVLASPVHARGGPGSRLRPSNSGFVVFKSRESAQTVLTQGPTHIVVGVQITVVDFLPNMLSQHLQ